ncbi:MAG: TolC family protein [Pedobacter sp.]|nr:TolC family protein [Pedobacter sp.]
MKKNNITAKKFACLFGLAFFAVQVNAQEQITLSQAIDSMLKNNLQIKQAEFSERLSYQNLRLAKATLYPTLNANASAYSLNGRSLDPTTYQFANRSIVSAQGSLLADVTLFQGFQKLNLIKQNKFFLEADKNNTKKVRNDLTLSVLSTYLQVLINRDLLKASEQQLALAKQQLSTEETFFKVKQKTLADLSQARSQVASAELNKTNAQIEMDRSYLFLAQLMQRNPAEPFLVVEPGEQELASINNTYTESEIYARSLQKFPDILLAVNNRLGHEKAVSVARGRLAPVLSLSANLNTSYSDNNRLVTSDIASYQPVGVVENTQQRVLAPSFNTNSISFANQIDRNFSQAIGLTLNIPILNGMVSRINLTKAKIEYENAVNTELLAKDNLKKVVAEAVWNIQASEKKYKSAKVTFTSAVDAFTVMRQRYTVGLVNSLDVNIAQTDRNIAEFALIQAKYDLIFKNKLIDYYLGNPITF